MAPFRPSPTWAVVTSLLGFACGGDGGGGPGSAPNTLAKAPASGDGQTDTVLATLGTPYRVIARDANNAPVQGVIVSWSVTGGGGSVSSPTSGTDAAGVAQVTHTFGSAAGAQSVRAAVTGFSGSPVTFTSTATAGVAFEIAASGGSGSHAVNSSFPLSAIARDKYGNARSGVLVSWAAQAGTGSVSPTQSTTAADGIASTTRTLGATPGTYTDTAYASGLQGSPVLFTVNATTAPTTASVSVGNNFFNPNSVTIAQAGSVTWTWNSAGATHNVTFAPVAGAPANISDRTTGSVPRTFDTPGTFNYECTIHSGIMTGSVTVLP